MANRLRIGTRGSPMALIQTGFVRDRLCAAHPELVAELVTIRTTGDRVQNRLLAEIGGKGLFTKEIEEALFDGRIDVAVHSLKDMETLLPQVLHRFGTEMVGEDVISVDFSQRPFSVKTADASHEAQTVIVATAGRSAASRSLQAVTD